MSLSLQKIFNNLNGGNAPLLLKGLAGSSKALVVSLLSKMTARSLSDTTPIVVVCESFDIAEVFLQDIYYYFGREGVYFFPFWDVLPYDNFSPHKGLTAQRFQTLEALISKKVRILITTPNALMHYFLPRNIFLKNTFILTNEFIASPDEICNMLFNSGYIEVDVVEEMGEFSTHGEILDVFPLNLEKPVRLEFSETSKVKFIKPFDIQSQQTAQTKLTSLEILPAGEILFNQENINYACQRLPEYRKECNPDVLLRLRQKSNYIELNPIVGPMRATDIFTKPQECSGDIYIFVQK